MPPPRLQARPGARSRPGDQMESAPPIKSTFQFPRMPFSEIQQDMDFAKRPISADVFRTPTANDAKDLTDCFIEQIYNKRPDDFVQPTFGCLDEMEFPELYEDAIPQFHVFRQLQEMLTDATFPDFGLRDVHAPEKTRLHWQISALINFMKFRESRLAIFDEITGSADELAEKERIGMQERAEIEKEIATREEVRAKDEPEVDALKELVSDLSLKLSSLHKQQLQLAEETRESKASLSKLKEHAAAVKLKNMSEAEEVDRYLARVVSSPDRMINEMEKMSSEIENETENISGMEKRTREMEMRSSAAIKVVQDLEKVESVLEGVLDLQESERKREDEIIEAREAVRGMENEAKEYDARKNLLEREVASVQQKRARMLEQGGTALNSEEDRVYAEREKEYAREGEECKRKEEASVAEASELEQATLIETKKFADEVEMFAKQHDDTADKFAAYSSDVRQALEMISADGQKSLADLRSFIEEK